MRIIHFKSFKESVTKIMLETNTLTVHELYVYELVKFFYRSILKMHAESFLNNLFSFEKTSIFSTRRSTKNYLSAPMTKKQTTALLYIVSWK